MPGSRARTLFAQRPSYAGLFASFAEVDVTEAK
jgi:hypothetical protein